MKPFELIDSINCNIFLRDCDTPVADVRSFIYAVNKRSEDDVVKVVGTNPSK